MIKMAGLKSMAERRRQERFMKEGAMDQMRASGLGEEIVEAVAGLHDKGLITIERLESGEYMFKPTAEGEEIAKILGMTDE